MTFDYITFEVDPSPTNPTGIVRRPELVLRVRGERSDEYVMALVDTGADECVLPLSLGESIGVAVDTSKSIPAAGVGGQLIELLPGLVELEIADGSESYRWALLWDSLASTVRSMSPLVSGTSEHLSSSLRRSMTGRID